MKEVAITIRIEGGVTLGSLDVWPDGDGPDHPSAGDIARMIEDEGSLVKFLERWEMSNQVTVYVTVETEDKQGRDEAQVDWP